MGARSLEFTYISSKRALVGYISIQKIETQQVGKYIQDQEKIEAYLVSIPFFVVCIVSKLLQFCY